MFSNINKMNKTVEQFIKSASYGLVSTVTTLTVSYALDHVMDDRHSNIIGLCCGFSVDFFIQKYIFTEDAEYKNRIFMFRYIIAVISTIILTQLIYLAVRAYSKKHYKHWYDKHWNDHKTLLIVRYLSKAFSYTVLEFPLNKFWVFAAR